MSEARLREVNQIPDRMVVKVGSTLVVPRTAGSPESVAEHIADASLRLHGAAGLVRGSSVERLFREARALRLREGTSEMLRLELADSILKESR
jgi:alkylation response protein AidB-like acyl-CoA dehydrogenase